MNLIAIVVGLFALIALVTKRGRRSTPEEDSRARTIGEAIRATPMMESLGAAAAPEIVASPFASDHEPDGDHVIRIDE